MKIKQNGFTLLELMMVIAIIGILAAIAVPQYGNYTKRAKFTEVIIRTATAKSAVSLCFQEKAVLTGCSGDGAATSHPGIPTNITSPGSRMLDSLTISNGEITAKGHLQELDGHTYILKPTVISGKLAWDTQGSCINGNLCKP